METITENVKVVKRLVDEFFNAYKTDVVDEIVGPDCEVYLAGKSQPEKGPQCYKRMLAEDLEGLPDLHFDEDEMIVSGSKVILRWTMTGTHSGTFFGAPPTHKTVLCTGVSIYHIVDGKIVDDHVELDTYGLLMQLGAIPSPEGDE